MICLEILAWSFQALALGNYREVGGADGAEWQPDGYWRKQCSGEHTIRAALVECKGDWKQLCQCFLLKKFAQTIAVH